MVRFDYQLAKSVFKTTSYLVYYQLEYIMNKLSVSEVLNKQKIINILIQTIKLMIKEDFVDRDWTEFRSNL